MDYLSHIPQELKNEILKHIPLYHRYPLYFVSRKIRLLVKITLISSDLTAKKICAQGDFLSLVFADPYRIFLDGSSSYNACKNKHIRIFRWLIKNEHINWSEALQGASFAGNDELIDEIEQKIPKSPRLSSNLLDVYYKATIEAANGGYLNLALRMAKSIQCSFDLSKILIIGACISNNYEMFLYSLNLGVHTDSFEEAAHSAYREGKLESYKWLEEAGYNPKIEDIGVASSFGNLEIVKYLISKFPNFDLKSIGHLALRSKNNEMAKYFIDNVAPHSLSWVNRSLLESSACGNLWLFEMSLNYIYESLSDLTYIKAAYNGHLDIIKTIIKRFPNLKLDFDVLLRYGASNDDKECLDFALKMGATAYESAYFAARNINAYWIMDLMKKKDPLIYE